MDSCYIALIVWYAIPGVAVGACRWWETDIIMGHRGAYWDARFDIRGIAESLCYMALWPLAAYFVVQSFYLRWPRGKEMELELCKQDEEIRELKRKIEKLERDIPAPPQACA